MVKVISIQPEYEVILGFLFPNYTIVDSAAVTSKFITHRIIKSKAEREALDLYYSEGVFISSQIFDELWDEEKIAEECVKFSHQRFKNRKKTLKYTKDTFIKDCINFIFDIPSIEEETTITDLFDKFGSGLFPQQYFKLIEKIPYQQVIAALTTFINKLDKESPSVYYKKKAILLEDKVNTNLLHAIDNYNLSNKDDIGVVECKLFIDLVK